MSEKKKPVVIKAQPAEIKTKAGSWAMAETVFNDHKRRLARGLENWAAAGGGDYRALLLTGAVTIDPDDITIADLIAAPNTEAVHASYARQALAEVDAALDQVNNRANLDAATINFGALTAVTPTALVIYRHVDGTNANDLLVSIHDTNFGVVANGAGYTVEWPNDVIRVT